jgi:hypothetical protein
MINFLAMFRIHLPMNTKFFATMFYPVDRYLSFFSIDQDWMMFAPVPNRGNIYLSAEVEFIDGTKENYMFPRTSMMTLSEKYDVGERFRKITTEGIRRDDFNFMWPDTARFVLKKMKEQTGHKLPLRVHLSRNWEIIPDINVEFRRHGEPAHNYNSHKFYTYEVL